MAQCIKFAINFISSQSPYSQIGMGGGLGFAAGSFLTKIGKLAAIALGGGVILLQIAEYQGLVHVDWIKLKQNFSKITVKSPSKMTMDNAGQIPSHILYFVISFIGGAFIGIGCS